MISSKIDFPNSDILLISFSKAASLADNPFLPSSNNSFFASNIFVTLTFSTVIVCVARLWASLGHPLHLGQPLPPLKYVHWENTAPSGHAHIWQHRHPQLLHHWYGIGKGTSFDFSS